MISFEVKAQFKNYNTEKEIWKEGVLYPISGEKIEGEINYNFVVDQVRVRAPGREEQIFVPHSVNYFIVEDSTEVQVSYSLQFDYLKKGNRVYTIFHKLFSNEHYMLLMKHITENEYKKFYQNNQLSVNTYGSTDGYFQNYYEEKVIRIIYIASKNGDIVPCLEKKVKRTQTYDWLSYVNPIGYHNNPTKYKSKKLKKSVTDKEVKKYKLVDRQELKDFFGHYYFRLERYIEKNNLNIKTLDGLISALDFRE